MKIKKVYIAKRIPKNPPLDLILNINSSMTIKEIHSLYIKKTIVKKNYIHNGHWILRPPISENKFTSNPFPLYTKPADIWQMVKEKIETSNVVVGIVNGNAYGTIAELGYACKCKDVAVYVLPDNKVDSDELQDLWFLFQIIKDTKHLWSDEDIKNIEEFAEFNIFSLKEYECFLDTVIPNFMK